MIGMSICYYCTHKRELTGLHGTCVAFPNGIPDAIGRSAEDHRYAYPGDQGIRFTPVSEEGTEYAANLFGPWRDYPDVVLAYGAAGRALYDQLLAIMLAQGETDDEAASNLLATWDIHVKAKLLTPLTPPE